MQPLSKPIAMSSIGGASSSTKKEVICRDFHNSLVYPSFRIQILFVQSKNTESSKQGKYLEKKERKKGTKYICFGKLIGENPQYSYTIRGSSSTRAFGLHLVEIKYFEAHGRLLRRYLFILTHSHQKVPLLIHHKNKNKKQKYQIQITI
jgi:hypothetical protein